MSHPRNRSKERLVEKLSRGGKLSLTRLYTGDVITTPSAGMLDAIGRATLNDDVYGEDQTTSAFEREMASICGKEAAAFVITGTMANQLSLRTLLNEAPPYSIMTDSQSREFLLLLSLSSPLGRSRRASKTLIPF
jgi:hypothetical protein